MPTLTPYILISLLSAAIIAAMGICLLALALPVEPELRNYRISRRFLGAAYIALALQSIAGVVWNIRIHTGMLVPVLQAFLFTFSLITLLNLGYATLRRVLTQFAVIAFFGVLILLDALLPSPVAALSHAVTVGYFCLLAYYIRLFFREYRDFKRRADNFYAGNERNFLRWVLQLFVMAAVVGAAAGMINGDSLHFRIFITAYTFVYVYMAIRYIDYLSLFRRIAPAVTAPEPAALSDREMTEQSIGEGIGRWLEEKEYVRADITLESLANTLGTNQSYLSRHINSRYGQNFRTWVNSLRVAESMRLMDDQPDLPLVEVAEKSGIRNLSTFYRQFSSVAGVTPAAYRKKSGGGYTRS